MGRAGITKEPKREGRVATSTNLALVPAALKSMGEASRYTLKPDISK